MCACVDAASAGSAEGAGEWNAHIATPRGACPAADSPLLDYEEILQLYRTETPSPALLGKLSHLLTRPFVSNRPSESGQRPLFPDSVKLGNFLRVAQWNIDRGLEFDAIRLAFSDPGEFIEFIRAKRPSMNTHVHFAGARTG